MGRSTQDESASGTTQFEENPPGRLVAWKFETEGKKSSMTVTILEFIRSDR